MSDNALIQIRGLVKTYGYRPVLKKLSLSVERGHFVALLGPNGSGKSTLLRLIAGLAKPSAGTITVGGWTIPREAGAVRSQIGMVGHKPLLYEALTARENLQFFTRLYGLPVVPDRIMEQLARVGLKRHADQPVRTYSRGMQQRLSIARALLHDPAVLLFDEPFTGLDQDACSMLDEMLIDAHTANRTILMATHQIERAARLAEQIVIMSRGDVVHTGPAAGLDGLTLARTYADVTGMVTT
jgi:heme exporter protein A